ncbi:TIGR04283 family arsenosugar biosynthesis glycosyltransferase [Gimesia panareensis]|uniref:TIGR04283 family arsenosugar biosynthesis glycosyltransferase n=1 Tax=Gimesia panareensis TaxID=2527978 RepID=UPI0018D7C83C|nr:TIGR04283 family arsenosugar biosynthesis glycosyltransferase [Gimesia panareensis]
MKQLTFSHSLFKKASSGSNMNPAVEISVVIPVLQGDDSWQELLPDLSAFPQSTEFLFVSNGPQPAGWEESLQGSPIYSRCGWQQSAIGRAVQMNQGAALARQRFLLFLHADSRLPFGSVAQLIKSLQAAPGAVHYFNLQFQEQSFFLMQLNRWGVWFRSHCLGMPFGDQGLCLQRDSFLALGGFDESAPYGEDHLLVWKARQQGIRLHCTGAAIATSARKYRERGWLKVTLTHLWLTACQATPQLFLLIKERFRTWFHRRAQSPSS